MRWVTREKAKVDRIACPWVISRFVDKDAQFFFVPAQEVLEYAKENQKLEMHIEIEWNP